MTETPFTMPCEGSDLLAIYHPGHHAGADNAETGVVIVVGGPQYRVGSHRQFLLLARRLARAGIPVLRFDYRGMGDSAGDFAGFEAIDADIRAAVDALCARSPAVERVVLWGLCDAASANLFYAHTDPRVAGLVLLNPWVHSEEGAARTYLKHYYLQRLRDPAFWRKLAGGGVNIGESLRSLADKIKTVLGGGKQPEAPAAEDGEDTSGNDALAARMAAGMEQFTDPVLLLLSGRDFTAKEFIDAAARSALWQKLLGQDRVTRGDLAEADHTFSRAQWRAWVEDRTLDWVKALLELRGHNT